MRENNMENRKARGRVRHAPKETVHAEVWKRGKGGKVKSRKQPLAIGVSEAHKKGAKVPKKK